MYKGNRLKHLAAPGREREVDPRLTMKNQGWGDYVMVLLIFIGLRIVMLDSGVLIVRIPYLDGQLMRFIDIVKQLVESFR